MRSSQLHAPTLKEVPRDAEVASHQLLVRGGYIRKVAAGIYNFLPLGHRVLTNVSKIIGLYFSKLCHKYHLQNFCGVKKISQR